MAIGSVIRIRVRVRVRVRVGVRSGSGLGLDVLGEYHLLARLGHDRLEWNRIEYALATGFCNRLGLVSGRRPWRVTALTAAAGAPYPNPSPDAHTCEACEVTATSAALETRALK